LVKEQGGLHAVLSSESHLPDVGGDPLSLDALLTGMVGNKTKERSRWGGAAGQGRGCGIGKRRGGRGRLLNTPGGSD